MKLVLLFVLAALLVACVAENASTCIKNCQAGTKSFYYCKYKCTHPNFNKEMEDVLADQQFRTQLRALLSDSEIADPEIDKNKLWDQVKEGLTTIFTQNTPSNTLRISNKYIDASSWTNPDTFSFFSNWPPIFSPSFQYDQQESWQNAYGDWLFSIKMPPQLIKQPAELKALGKEVSNLMNEMDDEDFECKNLWKSRDSNYELFRQNRCLSYNAAVRSANVANVEYMRKTREFYGEYADLAAAITLFSERDKTKPAWLLLEDVSRFISNSEQGKTQNFEMEITKNSKFSESKWSSFSVGAGVGIPAGLPKGLPTDAKKDAGGQPSVASDYRAMSEEQILSEVFSKQFNLDFSYGQNKSKTTTKLSNYKLNIGATGYQYFHVYPSPTWYSTGVIKKYINHEYMPGRSKAEFFGIKGRIPLMMKGLFMVAKPSFTVYMSKDESENIKKSSGFGIEVGYGPVHVKADNQKGVTTDDQKDGSYKVAFTSTNPDPQVWAADVFVMDPAIEQGLLAARGK